MLSCAPFRRAAAEPPDDAVTAAGCQTVSWRDAPDLVADFDRAEFGELRVYRMRMFYGDQERCAIAPSQDRIGLRPLVCEERTVLLAVRFDQKQRCRGGTSKPITGIILHI